MKPKVAHLSSVHTATDTRIFRKECSALVSAGYDVTFIVQHSQDEIVNGIQILALPTPKNRFKRMFKLVWHLYQRAKDTNADIYHFHDPELLVLGLLLALSGKKVIYDAHEDTPAQILDKEWINPLIRWPVAKALALLEHLAITRFKAVVTATPTIAKRFPAFKTETVQNYPILGELETTSDATYAMRPHAITFTGGLTAGRGAREIISAIHLAAQQQDICLKLAGYVWPDSLQDELSHAPGWAHVDFLGWQDRQQVASMFSEVRAGLVLFHPLANHIHAQPNKLYEYMSAGLPVIASDFPLWREIIDSAECGLLVDPMDPEKIAEAINWILEHPADAEAMGQRGRDAVYSQYNWDAESVKLINLYERILS
ncbi:glycosyl transferase [bacterium endosymbiont of Escarpia laminata]|nr:MAG: glycosyl transferase [bacterium endosymbiont of Escarpia laminata]